MVIFPYLLKELNGNESIVLDFGCGYGRFTPDLAKLINGNAIGVDPVKELINLTSLTTKVEYLVLNSSRIPLADDTVDIVWICLVLGGIKDIDLKLVVSELNRVLKKNGLLFLVENTTPKLNGKWWIARSFEQYKDIFKFIALRHLHHYIDENECISIMAGRRI